MHSADKQSPLRTRSESAQFLRISVRQLDYLVATGQLIPTRIGDRVLFAMHELDRFIQANTVTVGRGELVSA